MIKRFFLFLSLSFMALLSFAQEECNVINGVMYTIIDTEKKLCTVSPRNYESTEGDMDFYNSSNLKGDIVILEKVPIGDDEYTVVEIADMAFRKSNISHIQLPNTITRIGLGAFHASTIQNIVIPESVTEIGESAFFEATYLDEVIMGNKVTKLGKHAFNDCRCLKKVVLSNKIKVIEEYTFAKCISLEEINIPTSLTKIDQVAFGGDTKLKTLTMPATLKTVGENAFYKCSNLEVKNMPATAQVAQTAYDYCKHKYNLVKKKWNGKCNATILNKVIELWKNGGDCRETPIGTPLQLLKDCEKVMEKSYVFNAYPFDYNGEWSYYNFNGTVMGFFNGNLKNIRTF